MVLLAIEVWGQRWVKGDISGSCPAALLCGSATTHLPIQLWPLVWLEDPLTLLVGRLRPGGPQPDGSVSCRGWGCVASGRPAWSSVRPGRLQLLDGVLAHSCWRSPGRIPVAISSLRPHCVPGLPPLRQPVTGTYPGRCLSRHQGQEEAEPRVQVSTANGARGGAL